MKIPTKRRLSHLDWVKDQTLKVVNTDSRNIGLRATQDLIDLIHALDKMGCTLTDHLEVLQSANKKPLPSQKKLDL